MPERISVETYQLFSSKIDAAQSIVELITLMDELHVLFISSVESDDWIVDAIETTIKKRARHLQYRKPAP